MSKSISQARILRLKSAKLRKKAKQEMLKNYPKLMEDLEMRKKTFEAIDNANIAVDANGELHIIYEQNNNLENLKIDYPYEVITDKNKLLNIIKDYASKKLD